MRRRLRGITFRLAVGYGVLVAAAVAVMSAVFYFGTIGVINRGIDAKISAASARLIAHSESRGVDGLRQEIEQLLNDGIDQDTEVYALFDAEGQVVVGNLAPIGVRTPVDRLADQEVVRNCRQSLSRLLPHRLPNGDILVVGRDLQDISDVEQLVVRTLLAGATIALALALVAAIILRRLLERRVAEIRRTAREIEAGDLTRRIPEVDADDEFTRLSADINRMLDRIQHLMAGVRDVSNAVAHDLRTPLGRIRVLLEEAARQARTADELRDALTEAIDGVDSLIGLSDKLLQIAEAESGTRRRSFETVFLDQVITDVVELFDATAEAEGAALIVEGQRGCTAFGDRRLLATATANLVDNALKYAGASALIRVGAHSDENSVSITVTDDGPGIPPEEQKKVLTRFYRLDRSRSLPGNGLGLPIAVAISNLHGGQLRLADAEPGLVVKVVLPRAETAVFPNGNVLETARINMAG